MYLEDDVHLATSAGSPTLPSIVRNVSPGWGPGTWNERMVSETNRVEGGIRTSLGESWRQVISDREIDVNDHEIDPRSIHARLSDQTQSIGPLIAGLKL